MQDRFSEQHIDTWRRDGAAMIPGFFTDDEVLAVRDDFERVFGHAREPARASVSRDGERTRHASQYVLFGAVPHECSPALNLAGVHPALLALVKRALRTEDVLLYECFAWAKFTGVTDYDQPFHCDYMTHTLTAPEAADRIDALTVACYFSDVSEEHGPMHYVRRTDAAAAAPPEATLAQGAALDARLTPFARSAAGRAGSLFVYAMDVYHRGTNLRAPGGHRFSVFASFKRATSHAIGNHAWPAHAHDVRPWRHIFDHASPEQLACFGVPRPGDPFWTERTIAQTQLRYAGWKSAPYREALR